MYKIIKRESLKTQPKIRAFVYASLKKNWDEITTLFLGLKLNY